MIFEIIENAKTHSKTDFIYTCGQFFPKKKILAFTITDIGIGFKNNISQFFNRELSSIDAIRWVIKEYHTTKNIPGGIGFSILKEFISFNKGKIQIISGDGFYQFYLGNEEFKTFSNSFSGSIINIEFNTDDKSSYDITDENIMDDLL